MSDEEIMPPITENPYKREKPVTPGGKYRNALMTGAYDRGKKAQYEADLKVLDKIKAGWVETYNEQVVICRNLREAHGLELEAERKKWVEKCGDCDTPLLREGELYQGIEAERKKWVKEVADRIENCLNISPKELPRIIAELRRGKKVEYYGEGTVTDPRD